MSAASKSSANGQQTQLQLYRGIVKQVNSGESVIIRSFVNKDGKCLEKQVMLAHINVPRLGRRINANSPDAVTENDQPYAFEAREFLRKKLVGKEVCFVKETSTTSNVDRGTLYLGKDTATGENIVDALVSAGLADVRRQTNRTSEEETRLVALEDHAKSQAVGKWSKDAETDHIRDIKYTIDNPTNFVDSHRQKPIDAIIEYVRDATTMRVLLLPSYHNVTVQLAGIKSPGFKRSENDQPEVAEPFAEEAKHFVESRLLQRDIKVILEGVANQTNGILLGTFVHPNGNISEFLLREGLAKCIDWSIGVVTSGADKYRAAEKQAKVAKLKLWKNYIPPQAAADEASRNLSGKVVEVLNGDGIVIKLSDGTSKKLFLSSIRPPRMADFPNITLKADRKNNPLYDVPYLFEAREFLRKKLIGKKVICTVDYVQPEKDGFPEKVCCTVMLADTNIAEAIVSQGLARVIRYKQDDDQRSSKYDDLLTAEARAQKKAVGLHSAKEPSTLKLAEISGDVAKAKQFFPTLQRGGRMSALVEFVSSGSRFRLYLAKETCIITLLLGGIECARTGRAAYGTSAAQPGDEYGEEAFQFSKSHCLQHEVKVEVESIDKGGNFIGQLFTDDGLNLSVALVDAGYASVHKTALNSPYYALLSAAELKAKEKRLNVWKNYVEEKTVVEAAEAAEKSEPQERVLAPKRLVITEVTSELHFFGQLVENGAKLEQLTGQLRAELEARPPVPGAYTPKVGDLCVAKFSADDEWYRARVLSASSAGAISVLFVDYGNREKTSAVRLAQLPAGFDALPAQAHEYSLALVALSSDEDDNEAAVEQFKQLVFADADTAEFTFNTEYKQGTVEFVTLSDAKKVDLGKKLIADGFLSVDKQRRERRLGKLLVEYQKALIGAKQAHKNMWRYGDKEQDDAAEFGVSAAIKAK